MTLEEQIRYFDKFTDAQSDTMLKKGNDYSNSDRLSNFKQVASITGQTSEQVCLVLIGIKVARLGQLLSGKTPNNESIDDSILDLANYTVLLSMLRNEQTVRLEPIVAAYDK